MVCPLCGQSTKSSLSNRIIFAGRVRDRPHQGLGGARPGRDLRPAEVSEPGGGQPGVQSPQEPAGPARLPRAARRPHHRGGELRIRLADGAQTGQNHSLGEL